MTWDVFIRGEKTHEGKSSTKVEAPQKTVIAANVRRFREGIQSAFGQQQQQEINAIQAELSPDNALCYQAGLNLSQTPGHVIIDIPLESKALDFTGSKAIRFLADETTPADMLPTSQARINFRASLEKLNTMGGEVVFY